MTAPHTLFSINDQHLENPLFKFSLVLFVIGILAIYPIPALGGALLGGAVSLFGLWIADLYKKHSEEEKRKQRQKDAKQYLAPELYRTIERVLYIHERAIPNFSCASTNSTTKPGDLKEDFIPHWPVLYPDAPQFSDLSGENAITLVNFYDSLQSLGEFVDGWWEREGQLPVNIFNSILHRATKSLHLAQICIDKFDLDKNYIPPHQGAMPLSARIERSLEIAQKTMEAHIKRKTPKAQAY